MTGVVPTARTSRVPGRAEGRHGAHEQQHAGKRRESGQAAQWPPGRLGHAESGGRNGGDAGGPLRPGSGNVQCQESSHGVAHQVPSPVAERIQYPRDSPRHRLDAEMFQPGALRGFAPAGQINEHPGTGRHTGKQREEAGPGPRGAVKVDIRCAGRGRRAFGALLDTHRAGAQFRGKDIPAQRGRFLGSGVLLNTHGHLLSWSQKVIRSGRRSGPLYGRVAVGPAGPAGRIRAQRRRHFGHNRGTTVCLRLKPRAGAGVTGTGPPGSGPAAAAARP